MTQLISNPAAAFKTVSDYLTYKASDGEEIAYPRSRQPFIAAGAIAAGDWVSLVGASATVPMKVETMDVSDGTAATLSVGVASEAAAAGEQVMVTTWGAAICRIDDTGAIVLGNLAIKHATVDGASGVVAVADAAVPTTAHLGVYLGPEIGTGNTAPVWVRGR